MATMYDTANIIAIVKENIPTWKDIDPSRFEIKEMSGLSGNRTLKVSISEASADIVPAAVAFFAIGISVISAVVM